VITLPKRCSVCKANIIELQLSYDDPRDDVFLCPNDSIAFVMSRNNKLTGKEKTQGTCCLCKNPAVAIVHDFQFNEHHTLVEWCCCEAHMSGLVRRDLKPKDALELISNFGHMTFLTHDDYYDQASGQAIQPHRSKTR